MYSAEATPLPTRPIVGWENIPIRENDDQLVDPLVPIGIGTEYWQIPTDAIYAGERISSPYEPGELEGANYSIFVRQNIANKLLAMQRELPRGTYILVYDGWRPSSVQLGLYTQYHDALARLHPEMDETALVEETEKYVRRPTPQALHLTGGAVDCVFVKAYDPFDKSRENMYCHDFVVEKENVIRSYGYQERHDIQVDWANTIATVGNVMNFGYHFDHGGHEAAPDYYRKLALQAGGLANLSPEEQEAAWNRHKLQALAEKYGFAVYPTEFWHLNDMGTQMGAAALGLEYATYGAVSLSQDNLDFEQYRRHLQPGINRYTGFGARIPRIQPVV